MKISASLRIIAISAILLLTAIGLFYAFSPTLFVLGYSVLEWFDLLNTISTICNLFLYLLFCIYAYKMNYSALFYGILIAFGIIAIVFFKRNFGTVDQSFRPQINFGFLLTLAHACTIFFSDARQNKWLRYYAVAITVVGLLRGNLFRIEFHELTILLSVLSSCVPILFIFLINDEYKKGQANRANDNEDIIDA